jgi:hypothetical protein
MPPLLPLDPDEPLMPDDREPLEPLMPDDPLDPPRLEPDELPPERLELPDEPLEPTRPLDWLLPSSGSVISLSDSSPPRVAELPIPSSLRFPRSVRLCELLPDCCHELPELPELPELALRPDVPLDRLSLLELLPDEPRLLRSSFRSAIVCILRVC